MSLSRTAMVVDVASFLSSLQRNTSSHQPPSNQKGTSLDTTSFQKWPLWGRSSHWLTVIRHNRGIKGHSGQGSCCVGYTDTEGLTPLLPFCEDGSVMADPRAVSHTYSALSKGLWEFMSVPRCARWIILLTRMDIFMAWYLIQSSPHNNWRQLCPLQLNWVWSPLKTVAQRRSLWAS